MFNLSGSEIVFLLLIALIVLGPEKLPEAVRKFGKAYAEIKKMSSGFQSELKSALDEPMREMRETADAFKKAVSFEFDDNGGVILHDSSPDATTSVAEPVAEGEAAPNAVDAAPAEPEPAEPEPAETATASNEPPLVRPPGPTFHSAAPQPKVVEAVEETTSE
ncbi:MAG: Sec-independent protein translocase protein TatB [Ilumatobacteraceae bacterium]